MKLTFIIRSHLHRVSILTECSELEVYEELYLPYSPIDPRGFGSVCLDFSTGLEGECSGRNIVATFVVLLIKKAWESDRV